MRWTNLIFWVVSSSPYAATVTTTRVSSLSAVLLSVFSVDNRYLKIIGVEFIAGGALLLRVRFIVASKWTCFLVVSFVIVLGIIISNCQRLYNTNVCGTRFWLWWIVGEGVILGDNPTVGIWTTPDHFIRTVVWHVSGRRTPSDSLFTFSVTTNGDQVLNSKRAFEGRLLMFVWIQVQLSHCTFLLFNGRVWRI